MAAPRGYLPPRTQVELDALAERLIDSAGCRDILPTPLENIAAVKDLELITDQGVVQDYFSRLTKSTQLAFTGALEKLRGAADLRARVVYVPDSTNLTSPRKRFTSAHEIAHQCIEWHQVGSEYLDDDKSLSPETIEEFEQEANYLGARLNFQGKAFVSKVRSVQPTIASILKFSAIHEMSFQATAWQFVEFTDEVVALGFYYPVIDGQGLDCSTFRLWKEIPSSRFIKAFGKNVLPISLGCNDDLIAIAKNGDVTDFSRMTLSLGQMTSSMHVQSYWNRFMVTVLVRRPPKLRSFLNRLSA